MVRPVFRFAPSPNGLLHLGHAYSALLNEQMARAASGRLLLRLEDTDQTRCKPEFISACLEDLNWLGISFEPKPLIQSLNYSNYDKALQQLWNDNHIYPCFCSRKQVSDYAKQGQDPDGQPLYGQTCRPLTRAQGQVRMATEAYSWRLKTDGTAASVWGDVMIAKPKVGSSYHIAVVVDDAAQGITHVVRGQDMEPATSIHRLLQERLALPHPLYHHHKLIKDETGRKLAKSAHDKSLGELRAEGVTALEIRWRLGFASK